MAQEEYWSTPKLTYWKDKEEVEKEIGKQPRKEHMMSSTAKEEIILKTSRPSLSNSAES